MSPIWQILVTVLDHFLCRFCRSPAPRLMGPSNQMEAAAASAAAAMAATVKDGNKGVPENDVKLKRRVQINHIIFICEKSIQRSAVI